MFEFRFNIFSNNKERTYFVWSSYVILITFFSGIPGSSNWKYTGKVHKNGKWGQLYRVIVCWTLIQFEFGRGYNVLSILTWAACFSLWQCLYIVFPFSTFFRSFCRVTTKRRSHHFHSGVYCCCWRRPTLKHTKQTLFLQSSTVYVIQLFNIEQEFYRV